MDHKILFGVSVVAVMGWVVAFVLRDPNAVTVALLITAYTQMMGILVAGQSRHLRWAVAIFLLGIPAALIYGMSGLRDADVAPVSALRG